MNHSDKDVIGGVSREYIIKQAKEFVREPTPEELEEARKAISYPGRANKFSAKVIQSPGQFFGIKIRSMRIGVWFEHEKN